MHPLTPLIRLREVFPERQVYAKCEFLAPSGCFKIRGAKQLLQHLAQHSSTSLLVVPSMGNTALGAAAAVGQFGYKMVGVVPETITRAKDQKLQQLGVELVKVQGGGSELLQKATQIAADRGGYFVHPHLDPNWTNGYQVIAAEIFQSLPECRSIVFPVGGGGLLMGLSEYLKKHEQNTKLHGCEPFNYPKYARFSHARTRTIADGLLLETPHPDVETRIKQLDIPITLLHDDDIRESMRDLYERHGLVVEPSSAITLACVSSVTELPEPICVVLTGQNIGRVDFDNLIAPSPAP